MRAVRKKKLEKSNGSAKTKRTRSKTNNWRPYRSSFVEDVYEPVDVRRFICCLALLHLTVFEGRLQEFVVLYRCELLVIGSVVPL